MGQLFMTNAQQPRRYRRTWEDTELSGMREAEAREGQAQRDSDSRDRAERDRGGDRNERDQSKPSNAPAPPAKDLNAERAARFSKAGSVDPDAVEAGKAYGMDGSWGYDAGKGVTGYLSMGPVGLALGITRSKAINGGGWNSKTGTTNDGSSWGSGRGGWSGGGGTGGQPAGNPRMGNDRGGQDSRKTGAVRVASIQRKPTTAATTQVQLARAAIYARDRQAGTIAAYRQHVMPRTMTVQAAIPFQIRKRSWGGDTLGGLDDEELAGLGKTLKKIGKKIGNAFKGKNLLKTAAIAATAYGGYKLVTSGTGGNIVSSIGSGLSKVGSAAAKVGSAVASAAPQLANSYIAYKQAETVYPGASVDAGASLPQGTYLADGTYIPSVYETGEPALSTTQSLPSWVIPAAIGAGVLLLMSRR